MKRVIFALLVITIITSAQAKYSGGTGTESNPYQIGSISDWNDLMYTSSDWDANFVMVADINLQGIPLIPVGNDLNGTTIAFTGVFDGNGHVIRNASMNKPGYWHIALFGIINSDAQIRNLGAEDVNMMGYRDVAGLVGITGWRTTTVTTLISNCYVTGTVRVSDGITFGGLVGQNAGTITGSHAACDVNGTTYIGGLVGRNMSGIIMDSYAAGTVSGTSSVGGLVGYSEIRDSESGGYDYAFPVITKHCYSSGSVSGNQYVGGLIGTNGASSLAVLGIFINDCFSACEVTGGNGFVGCNYGQVKNCYAVGKVIGSGVGFGSSGVTNCFWDINTTGKSTGGGGTGKTTAQMQTLSTFAEANWDFNNVWHICEAINYPRLRWSIPAADFVCPDGVNFVDYSFFAKRWMNTNCAASNNCDGTDFDSSGTVDLADLKVFCNYWLQGL